MPCLLVHASAVNQDLQVDPAGRTLTALAIRLSGVDQIRESQHLIIFFCLC